MTDGSTFRELAELIALAVLSGSFLLAVVRVVLGPSLPDRILGLDMLVSIAIGFIAVIGIRTGYTLYLDIAIALGLVGFLATVAFARFVLSRRYEEEFIAEDTRGIYGESEND
ncbi:cation:proton antiporter [Nitratireductor luteus]|uniref:cation:proton antiporter n=1 Tax=Nitratireductor luteus TaxID=2976980 RepID=UPI00223FF838|nr:cation:proton antiporter [Nitratireductor luteus]